MSQLVFDGTAHTLTLYDSEDDFVDRWPANNVVDRKAKGGLRFVPNRLYPIQDQVTPFRHGQAKDKRGVVEDSANGAYGLYGIIRLRPFTVSGVRHDGIGVHSGRANSRAQNHATMGCIRTIDEAMRVITQHMASDPLLTILVVNNHDQLNTKPSQRADSHYDPSALGGTSVLV